MEKKTVDAVAMTRHIRDQHFVATKHMTPEERTAYYREKAREVHDQLVEEAHQRKSNQAT